MPTMHNLCTNGKNQNWPAHSRNIKLLHARSQVCWDGYDEQSKTFRLLVPQPIYVDTEHWKPREKLNLFFPLSGPKYTGEKETISKNIYISCTSAQWNKLEIGKKKKCSFCPSIVFQNSRTFLCEIYPKNRQYRLWQGDINHGKFPSRFFSNGKKKEKIEQKDFRTENVNQFSLLASIFKTPIPPPSSSCIYLHMSTKTLRCILLNSLTLSSSISRASQIATNLYFIFSCSENHPVFFSSPSYLICQLRVSSVYISVTSV